MGALLTFKERTHCVTIGTDKIPSKWFEKQMEFEVLVMYYVEQRWVEMYEVRHS